MAAIHINTEYREKYEDLKNQLPHYRTFIETIINDLERGLTSEAAFHLGQLWWSIGEDMAIGED